MLSFQVFEIFKEEYQIFLHINRGEKTRNRFFGHVNFYLQEIKSYNNLLKLVTSKRKMYPKKYNKNYE